MMHESVEERLNDYYARFDRGHDRRRVQLLASLDGVNRQSGRPGRPRLPGLMQKAIAAAACLMLVAGGLYMMSGGDASQEAYAKALHQFSRIDSVHLKMVTPNPNTDDPSVEMWWRRPGDFRMEFSTGLIMTGNREKRCTLDPGTNELQVQPAGGPGPEMLILGELGRLFTEETPFIRDWIDKSQILKSELIDFKGERCRKIVCQKDAYQYEYIIDAAAKGDQQAPFYQVKVYDLSGKKLLSHMEVLKVNVEWPDRLFVIEPPAKK